MAADLLIFGLELLAATTAALVLVIALRWPVRAAFGARATYGLWLLLPAVMLAVALPRVDTSTPSVASTTSPAPTPAPVDGPAPASTLEEPALSLERPAFVPNPKELAVPLLGLWALGAGGYALLLTVGQRRFLQGLGALRREQLADGPVFHARTSDAGPALVGAFRPRVVLPGDFADRFTSEEQAVVLAHERVHLRSGDAQINLLVAAFLALFWFNPLAHLGARLIRADQELACDETVMSRFPRARRLYAEAMLKTQLVGAPVPLGCHWLSGGKIELRRRIARLHRTPARARRLAGLALAATLAAGGGVAAWAAQPPVPGRSAPSRDAASNSVLVAAIQDGRIDQAAALIEAGADLNTRPMGEASPLMTAVREGELSLTRLLLDSGAEPNQAVPGDGTALIIAADNGDLAIARLLLAHGADPNLASRGDGNPLIAAAAQGHTDVVDLLLTSGARVDDVVTLDETALITAARRSELAVVRRLVEAGADVNLAVMAPRAGLPPERRSPLGMARRSGRSDMVDYLRARGARA